MQPLNCWIIEDEPPALRRLTKLLHKVNPSVQVSFAADSVAATTRALQKEPHPDFILSDIHLADGLCFQIWEQGSCRCPIIFTTAYDQYSIRAFRVNSIDYLLKPVEEGDLKRALNKLSDLNRSRNQIPDWSVLADMMNRKEPAYRERFLVQHRQEWIPLKVSELRQIYSEDSLTFGLTANGQRYLLDESLDRVEEELNPHHWFRINRAQIIHIEAVSKVQSYFNHRLILELEPSAEQENIVSRPRVKACRNWLGR